MILRICVVIPVFDNPRTISRVTRDVVLNVPHPVLIIDDGSETPVANVLYSFEVKEAIQQGRVRIIRFEKRLGKGAALRYALRDLAAGGFTHMMTLDGDGRHLGRELKTLVTEARARPWDLILGRRAIAKSRPRTKWARLVARVVEYCVRFETGTKLEDPQSGFRLYPLFPLQMLRFRTKNYDFDLEILIRALWNGVAVREVPVAVAEPEETDLVPTRRGWIDSLRLSTLNLILITVTLLRSKSDPLQLSLALGLGVFIGCSPLIGFHTAAAFVFAAVTRLNVVAVLVGSRISMAPLFPFLYLASVHIGQHWLKLPPAHQGYMSNVWRYGAGSLVLGLIAGPLAAAVTYVFARAAQNPRPETRAARGGAGALAWVSRRGGRGAATVWSRVAAVWYFLTSMQVRKGLREFYRTIAPKLDVLARWRRRIGHIRRFIDLEADRFLPDVSARVEGDSDLDFTVSAHLGSWEVAARAAGLEGKAEVHFPDRPTETGRVEIIPFLGHLAAFDVSAFAKAAADSRKLNTAFAIRAREGYVIHARGARRYTLREDASPELQIYEWASRYVVQLEFMVKKHPDQWTKLYRFWSTIPRAARESGQRGITIEELYAGPPRLRPQRTDH